jgi:hypothetical protein
MTPENFQTALTRSKHRAVRELTVPSNAQEPAKRLLGAMNERTVSIS